VCSRVRQLEFLTLPGSLSWLQTCGAKTILSNSWGLLCSMSCPRSLEGQGHGKGGTCEEHRLLLSYIQSREAGLPWWLESGQSLKTDNRAYSPALDAGADMTEHQRSHDHDAAQDPIADVRSSTHSSIAGAYAFEQISMWCSLFRRNLQIYYAGMV
jgi:hypothetical protein